MAVAQIQPKPGSGDKKWKWHDTARPTRPVRKRVGCRLKARRRNVWPIQWVLERELCSAGAMTRSTAPPRGRACTAVARLEAVITTAAMARRARAHGAASTVYIPPSWTHGAPVPPLRWPHLRRPGPQLAIRPARPQAHQEAQARVAAQRPGAGRHGSFVGAVKKTTAIFNKGEDE